MVRGRHVTWHSEELLTKPHQSAWRRPSDNRSRRNDVEKKLCSIPLTEWHSKEHLTAPPQTCQFADEKEVFS